MAKAPTKNVRKQVEPKAYSVWAKFNGMEFKKRTNDLDKTIQELKPDWLHTEVYITVTKGKNKSERALSLIQAKKVFVNPIVREVFINNLLLT